MVSAFERYNKLPPGALPRPSLHNPGNVPTTLSAGIVYGQAITCGEAMLAYGYDSECSAFHLRIFGEWTPAACYEALARCAELKDFCARSGDVKGRITDCRYMELRSAGDASSYAGFDLKIAEFLRCPHVVVLRGRGDDRFAEDATRFSRCKKAYRTQAAQAWLMRRFASDGAE